MAFPTSPTDGQTWIEGTTEYKYNATLGVWDVNGTTGVDILETYATKANPVFTGSVKIPDAVNADEAMTKGQLLAEMKAVDFVASKAANGYQKLPSGLIIQWGETASVAGGNVTTITFPISFPNLCASASVIRHTTNTTSSTLYSWAINALSATGADLHNGTSSTESAFWIAIGY